MKVKKTFHDSEIMLSATPHLCDHLNKTFLRLDLWMAMFHEALTYLPVPSHLGHAP